TAALAAPPLPLRPPVSRRPRSGFAWFLVVSEDPELGALVAESEPARGKKRQIELAETRESALGALRARPEGSGLVVATPPLRWRAGRGPHGLAVAAEARRRHHAVLLVTAAGDYFHYWSRLQEIGMTGHDVVIKTRTDFAWRLRARIAELAEPPTVK